MRKFVWKNKIAITACTLTIAFGVGFWVLSQAPTETSVGDDLIVAGRIGIGTSSPNYSLDVLSNGSSASPVLHLETTETVGAGADILEMDTEASTMGKAIISLYTDWNSDENRVWYVDTNGDHHIDGTFYNTGADYAEYFLTDDLTLEKGDLVCLANNGKVKKCNNGLPIGVVTTFPSVLGNTGDGSDDEYNRSKDPNYIAVGLIGQVPAKVSIENGVIRAGDTLAVGENGEAVKGQSPRSLLMIALESTDKSGIIKVLIK